MTVRLMTPRLKISWSVVNLLVLLCTRWFQSCGLRACPSSPPGTIKDGKFIPEKWTLDNYRGIFDTSAFTSALINSIGIGLISTVIAVVIGTMAAYAIARLDFPGKKLLVAVALLIAMFPQISLVSPLFDIERRLGLFDTWAGLILPYITFALPLAIYTLSAFFKEIPWELEKAAQMDGATSGAGVPEGGGSHWPRPASSLRASWFSSSAGTICCSRSR